MENNDQPDFLAIYAQSLHEKVMDFSRQYPDLWHTFNLSYEIVQSMQVTIAARYELNKIEVHRLQMWQSVLHYQIESLILFLSEKLDAGYALLRMATELSRDLACIGDDPKLLDIWLNNRFASLSKMPKEPASKNNFRFNDKSSVGATVHKIYKLCSDLGVHGHITESISSVPDENQDSGVKEIAILRVSEKAVMDAVQTWMFAFGPIQHLCVETFKPRFEPLLAPVFLVFFDFEIQLGKTAVWLADEIKKQYKGV